SSLTTDILTLSLHDALPISSTVSITGNPTSVEIAGIYDNQNDYIFDSEITNGAITIMCETEMSKCTVNGTTNANCFGESNGAVRSEEHTSELQSRENLVCRL